jgi:hypothetical protein
MVRTTETINLAVPLGMVERIDQVRGDVPRSRFVSRILEKALKTLERSDKNG